MKNNILSLSLLLISGAMFGQETFADTSFIREAALGGLKEVKLGQLALSRGLTKEAKSLGEMMLTDHSKASKELQSLVGKKMRLPVMLDKSAQKEYDDLAKKSGHDFDETYAEMMVDDHEKDLKKFRKEASDGKDATVRAWAEKLVPTLEHHLEMSKQTKEALEKTKK
jgi:putative membrane protein